MANMQTRLVLEFCTKATIWHQSLGEHNNIAVVKQKQKNFH